MKKTSHRVAAVGLVLALVLVPGLTATADDHTGPPQHVLEKATEGVARGQARALDMLGVAATRNPDTGIPDHAQGDPDHVTGLARAQEMVAKAADKIKGYEKDKDNNGNAFGRGHAADVHAALAANILPSTLEPHGQKTVPMVKALKGFTEEKPGRGLGRNKNDG